MRTDRPHRQWITALIVALLGAAVLVSAITMQVRADVTRSIADAPAASVRDNNKPNTSLRASILDGPTGTTTPTSTPTRTPTPTATASKTPVPAFNCSLISLSNKRLSGNQFQIDIQNNNAFDGYVTRVQLTWPNLPPFAQMGLTGMSMNGVVMWNGYDPQVTSNNKTTTDTDTKPGTPPFSSTSIAIRTVDAGSTNTYAAAFNGPPLLSTYVSANQYSIVLTLDSDHNSGVPCVLSSLASPPTATAPPSGQPSPTPSPTPDCGAGSIAIHFNSFDNFGIVRFDILSQRTTTSTLTGFNINWQKYVLSQKLAKVSLVAPPNFTGGVVVWDSGSSNEDDNPPTNSQTEGTWVTNFTIPPGSVGTPSVTPLIFDFEGIYRFDDYYGSTNPPYGGPSDFNFSEFAFTCDNSGGQPPVQISPEIIPSPTLFPTLGATITAAPTATSTPTPETRDTEMPPTTSTYTPTPISTSTYSPTSTATATPTPTMTPIPSATAITPTSVPNIAPKINFYTTRYPTLTWTGLKWATHYEIQISKYRDFPPAYTSSAIVSDDSMSYIVTPDLADGMYYWRVRAFDAHNNTSGWSNIDTFYISYLPTATADLGH